VENNEQIVINKNEKANSFEVGRASARHKIYYETPEELKEHLDKLKEIGLYIEEA